MGVFRATLAGREGFENIETDHACLADLVAELQQTGIIVGSKLWTRRGDGPGERLVTGRQGIAITPQGLLSIEDCTVRFVELDA